MPPPKVPPIAPRSGLQSGSRQGTTAHRDPCVGGSRHWGIGAVGGASPPPPPEHAYLPDLPGGPPPPPGEPVVVAASKAAHGGTPAKAPPPPVPVGAPAGANPAWTPTDQRGDGWASTQGARVQPQGAKESPSPAPPSSISGSPRHEDLPEQTDPSIQEGKRMRVSLRIARDQYEV